MHEHSAQSKRFKWEWVVICSFLLAAVLMLTGHKSHLFGALPYLLILACPMMHLFMHKGHSHTHNNSRHHDNDEKEQAK